MFPEILYDGDAFPDPTLRWMRDRIAYLMPTPYVRQRSLYEMYAMRPRREALIQWRNANLPHLPFVAPSVQETVPVPAPVPAPVPVPQTPTDVPMPVTTQDTSPVPAPPPGPPPAEYPQQPFAPEMSPISNIGYQHPAESSLFSTASMISEFPSTIVGTIPSNVSTNEVVLNRDVLPSTISTRTNPPHDDVEGNIIIPRTPVFRRNRLIDLAIPPRLPRQIRPRGMDELFGLLMNNPGPQNMLATLLNNNGRSWNHMPDDEMEEAIAHLMEDIPIIPTMEEVERGSELTEEEDAEVICSVCQHHAEVNISVSTWRRLYCGHSFHRACVDRWFRQHIACPVCRADIREAPSDDTSPSEDV